MGVSKDSLLSGLSRDVELKDEDIIESDEEAEDDLPEECEMEGLKRAENGGYFFTIPIPVIQDIQNRQPDTEDAPGLIIVTQLMMKLHIRFSTRAMRDTLRKTIEAQCLPPAAPSGSKSPLEWLKDANGYSPTEQVKQLGQYAEKWDVHSSEWKSLATLKTSPEQVRLSIVRINEFSR